jgi:hypothetical protein
MCICEKRRKLRVSKDRVLRKAFGSKRDDESEDW